MALYYAVFYSKQLFYLYFCSKMVRSNHNIYMLIPGMYRVIRKTVIISYDISAVCYK